MHISCFIHRVEVTDGIATIHVSCVSWTINYRLMRYSKNFIFFPLDNSNGWQHEHFSRIYWFFIKMHTVVCIEKCIFTAFHLHSITILKCHLKITSHQNNMKINKFFQVILIPCIWHTIKHYENKVLTTYLSRLFSVLI